MRLKVLFCLIALISACGKAQPTPELPQSWSERLSTQIQRMEPQLNWCDGVPAFNHPHDYNGQPRCAVGDGMGSLGFVMLYGHMGSTETIKASIGSDGRPWRAPSYVGVDPIDTSSRDMYLGLLEATYMSGDIQPLDSVYHYWLNTGALCPSSTDNRCDLTPNGSPSLLVPTKDRLGLEVNKATRLVDMTILNTEAKTVPLNFQAFLVARVLMLRVFEGRVTNEYKLVASTLHSRAPNNLFFRMVERIMQNGSEDDFKSIAEDLATCMESWSPGNELHWAWHSEGPCRPNSHGAELVAVAKFLLRDRSLVQEKLSGFAEE